MKARELLSGKIETPYSKEVILKEQERIKNANNQSLMHYLKEKGIDAEKIPRIEWDKLLRIMKAETGIMQEYNKLHKTHSDIMAQFDEIVAPYKLPPPELIQEGITK